MKRYYVGSAFVLVLAILGGAYWYMNRPQLYNDNYELKLIVEDGLERPLYLLALEGDPERLFVLEQGGRVRIIENGTLLEEPFLDIDNISTNRANEQGLLGMVFHPDYAENGYFYVNFSDERTDGDTVVARFSVDPNNPNRALRESYTEIIRITQPYRNHNGGMIAFGPDGYLYIGMGDGGSGGDPQNHGQNPKTLLGTLLRVDVDNPDEGKAYGIPADNPFVDGVNGAPEVWAYGLRNPWRFSFDSETGDLYIADVGQNEREEINFLAAGSAGGQNYGWRVFEGTYRYTDGTVINHVEPVAEYSHGEGCSVTGGYVYRGTALPDLVGVYLYADYCNGKIWTLEQDAAGQWQTEEFMATGLSISSFGVDAAGELYVIDHEGRIYQLVQRES